MPTIGQLDFAVAGSGLASALADFDCGNFLPLVLVREEALVFALSFLAIGRVYVNLRLHMTQAAM
jgi:hypothetical protein